MHCALRWFMPHVLTRQPVASNSLLQGALRADLAPVDATSVVPLERWDLGEQEAVLGGAPIRHAAGCCADIHGALF